MHFRTNVIFLLSVFFLLRPGYSETNGETETAPPPPPPARLRHFSVYVWPVQGVLSEFNEIPALPQVFYNSPDGVRRVPLSRNVASPLLPYYGPLPIEFFDAERVVTPPPPDSPPGTEPTVTWKKTPITTLSFPESWDQILFVMMPGRGGTVGQFLPIRYDAARVRPGYIRIVNTTDEDLVVEIQDRFYPMAGNSPVDFRPPTESAHQVFRINIYGRDERHGSVRLRLTTRVSAREATSNLYLLYPASQRRLRLMRVGGHEPPPTPTPVPTPVPETRTLRQR
jgi:hypothetical protein